MEVRSCALFFLILGFFCLSVSSESQKPNPSRGTNAVLPDKNQVNEVLNQEGKDDDEDGKVNTAVLLAAGRGRGSHGGGQSNRKSYRKEKSAAPVGRQPCILFSAVSIFFTALIFSLSFVTLFHMHLL